MKRRTLLQHTSALTLLGLLTACGGSGSNDTPGPGTQAQSTLLIYMVASDLLDGRGAERDLLNMLKAHNSPQVQVVLQIGGGKTAGQYPSIDMQQTRRYRLVPQAGTREGWTLQALPADQQPAQVAMNQPATLRDFIAWGARTFPAQQYALSLWNHGGGPIGGFGNDEALGGGTPLSVPDIQSALQQAGIAFELIGFDCCLMASLEVAKALAPHSRYLVASEEITYGWEWNQVVSHLATHPSGDGQALGRAIIESYKGFDTSRAPTDFTAYSLSHLGQIGPVMAALDAIAQNLTALLQERGLQAWWGIALARREALDFQSNLFNRTMDLVDVKDWMHQLGQLDILPSALLAQFHTAFKALVLHTDGGEDEAGGLMMYFPRYSTLDTKVHQKYSQLDFSPSYLALVQAYSAFATSQDMPYVEVGAPRLQADSMVADVALVARPSVKKSLPELKRPFDLGFGLLVKDGLAVGLQPAAIENQQIRLSSYQSWPQVQGQTLCLLKEDEGQDDFYQIPVLDEDSGYPGLLIALRTETGALEIGWFVSMMAEAGSNAAMLEIHPGNRYQPLHLDLSTQKWVLSPHTAPIQAPQASAGPWYVTQGQPSTASGLQVHLMATDLTGALRPSQQGIALA